MHSSSYTVRVNVFPKATSAHEKTKSRLKFILDALDLQNLCRNPFFTKAKNKFHFRPIRKHDLISYLESLLVLMPLVLSSILDIACKQMKERAY